MKKIIILLISVVLLTACSSNKGLTYKDDNVLYKIKDKTVRESDFYELLVSNDKGITLYTHMIDLINENSEAATIFEKEIEETITTEIEKLKESFGDDLELVIKQAGFESLDSFVETQLKPSVALQFEINDYVKNNLDELIKVYKLKDISVFATDDKEFAEELKLALEDGEIPSEINIEKRAKLDERIASKSYDSGSEALNKFLTSTTVVGEPTIVEDKESNMNYVVYVHDTDLATLLEPLVQVLIEVEQYTDIYTAMQFTNAKFMIYDKTLESYLKEIKPTIFK